MRLLTVCFLFISILVSGQPASFPAGTSNLYFLGEKEGYPGFNYFLFAKDSSGFTYSLDNNSRLCCAGNNFSVCTDTLAKLGATVFNMIAVTGDEVMVVTQKMVLWFRQGLISRQLVLPFTPLIMQPDPKNNRHLLLLDSAGHPLIASLEGQLIKSVKLAVPFTLNAYQDGSLNLMLSERKDVYVVASHKNGCTIFNIANDLSLQHRSDIVFSHSLICAHLENENSGIFYNLSREKSLYLYFRNGQYVQTYNISINKPDKQGRFLRISPYTNWFDFIMKTGSREYFAGRFKDGKPVIRHPFILNDFANAVIQVSKDQFIGSSGNKAFRLFPYIKQYPALFNNSNSASVFTVKQDETGRIWAGSYQGTLTLIHDDKKTEVPQAGIQFMNGGTLVDNKMVLIGEGVVGLTIYKDGRMLYKNLTGITGYSTWLSHDRNRFYFGTPGLNGLWQCKTNELLAGKPHWNKINADKGSRVHNILTITEDTLGRIWYGHGRRSLAVYTPATGKALTWEVEKKESPFGAFSSLTDKKGTVWIGSSTNGVWYYNDYRQPAHPSGFKKVQHPLLANNLPIYALTMYNEWLVIANQDKICLLHTDSLLRFHKTVVRYLNPQEAAFTSFTEQNTMLTSRTDSTVWFSTSDMLYQWNIKDWLQLERNPVTIYPLISYSVKTDSVKEGKTVRFRPGNHSFSIRLNYFSRDNLPRYLSATLVKDGDSINLPQPSMNDVFSYTNLSPGRYRFVMEVYEMNGQIIRHQFSIVIEKYIYQQWWFWMLISGILFGMLVIWIHLRQQRKVAEEKARTREAELRVYRKEQEQKMATLRLLSLSSQFRPHFILNALNTIGARMDNNPETESVLSRLGESVNLIFNHALQQKTLHPLGNEWKLVTNVIHIHQLMYLKNLEVILPSASVINALSHWPVPMGLLQIPVENALLHGLSNKVGGPWKLIIGIEENDKGCRITITDNGVGRKQSAHLSNYTKHGTGTKNMDEVIAIINTANKNKISLEYEDDIFMENHKASGTSVHIFIPRNLQYEN
jgi:Histidine kinase